MLMDITFRKVPVLWPTILLEYIEELGILWVERMQGLPLLQVML